MSDRNDKEKPTTAQNLNTLGMMLMFIGLTWTMVYFIYLMLTVKPAPLVY